MKSDAEVNREPLPGYRLLERLGTGGYGEVWRAEAPGGLNKAIKIVFGKHDEKRASHEMRALERIRYVRHPFLLSLERMEVVGGRLIVVMELADGSIKDRFDQCRAQGLPGVPRDEMVNYLRDAADALDYMAQSHALQHLDIKPENMLLLSGRVKVADFGLVKEVRQSQASLVGGLTPLYAAPEVFRGTPSSHSDQYSLAIVYQEMLTGTLPFAGSSAAELTLQHLNDEPDLTALSPADRYVVSRALAKEPLLRYSTCREFVDCLMKVSEGEVATPESQSPVAVFVGSSHFSETLPRATTQTDLFDDDASAWNAAPEHRLIELPPPDAHLIDLPAVDISGEDHRAVPTLFIGIGGTAARVLSYLRRDLWQRYDDPAAVPSFQLMLIDTDAKVLADANRRDHGLAPEETVHVPLRRPQHYREHSQQLLQWLSRRWLYNIPRSLRTEGLRPLGRLAMADHARLLGQRIRRGVLQAMEADATARTAESLGRDVRGDAVRVYVVASISGGSGGGMSLDLGYMVRAVLNKLRVADARIIGVMMHSTGGEPRACELARVNAYSWLTEFCHFQQPENAYPGDSSCGLPSHEPGIGAFDYTYLVHLGEQLDAIEYDQATQSVAEYLRLSALSSAQAFFEVCRKESDVAGAATAADRAKVRSFGLSRRTATENDYCDSFADQLARHVVLGWRAEAPSNTADGGGTIAGTCPTPRDAAATIQHLRMNSQGIATSSRSLVEARLGGHGDQFLASWLAKHEASTDCEAAQFQAIDQMFEAGPSDARGQAAPVTGLLGEAIGQLVRPLEENLRGEIRHWITGHIDNPRERLAGARGAIAWLMQHLQRTQTELQHFAATVAAKLADVCSAVAQGGSVPSAEIGENPSVVCTRRAVQYFRWRIDQLALAAATHIVGTIVSEINLLNDELVAFERELDQLLASIRPNTSSEAERPPSEAGHSAAAAGSKSNTHLDTRLEQLAAEVDRQLQAEFLSRHGGLMPTIMRGGRPRAQLRAKLHEFAGQAMSRALAGINVMEEVFGSGNEVASALRSALATVTPSLVQFGGTRRVLAVLPRDTADDPTFAPFSQPAGFGVTSLPGDDNSLTLCVETGQIPVVHAAVEFVQHRRDRVDFAARVHSRTDILWTPLIATSDLSVPCPWGATELPGAIAPADSTKTLVI